MREGTYSAITPCKKILANLLVFSCQPLLQNPSISSYHENRDQTKTDTQIDAVLQALQRGWDLSRRLTDCLNIYQFKSIHQQSQLCFCFCCLMSIYMYQLPDIITKYRTNIPGPSHPLHSPVPEHVHLAAHIKQAPSPHYYPLLNWAILCW